MTSNITKINKIFQLSSFHLTWIRALKQLSYVAFHDQLFASTRAFLLMQPTTPNKYLFTRFNFEMERRKICFANFSLSSKFNVHDDDKRMLNGKLIFCFSIFIVIYHFIVDFIFSINDRKSGSKIGFLFWLI